ncbi:hypothetical protein [Halobellus rufus]|nr:hypothetical protein [Halobellus rufus]
MFSRVGDTLERGPIDLAAYLVLVVVLLEDSGTLVSIRVVLVFDDL